MKEIREFIADWKLATNWERIKCVLVILSLLIVGIYCCYFLTIGISHENYMEILYSYVLFIIVIYLGKIKITPKAKKKS